MGSNLSIEKKNMRNFFQFWAELTIGKRGWCGSRTCTNFFKTWSRLENNPQNKVLSQWELNPGRGW
jgi:hypothetical protein